MLDEAITLIKKEINMYKVLEENTYSHARNKTIENKLRARIRKEIQLRDYIVNILEKQKE